MSGQLHVLATRVVQDVLDRPARWLAWLSLATLVLSVGVLRLDLRTDGASIYPTRNLTIEHTRADRRSFHEADQIIVLVTSRPRGAAVDSREGLSALKRLHRSLEAVPGVEAQRLRSVATLLDPLPGTPVLSIAPFLEEIPTDEREYDALLRRIHHSPLAEGLFLSSDGQAAAIYVPVARNQDRDRLVTDLEGWIADQRALGFDLRLTGPVTAEVTLGWSVLEDLARLIPVMIAVIAVLLFFALRSVGGVIVSLVEVMVVLLWTLGTMGYCGVPVTLVTTILPVVLLTMAVTDEIHLLDRFRKHLGGGPAGDAGGRARSRKALEGAIRDVARPIVLTSLTTSIGFLSFLTASIEPIRYFGLFTALGVLLAMILSFTFVPALIMLLPVSWFVVGGPRSPDGRPARLPAYERFVIRYSGPCALAGALLVLISAPGLTRLSIQDSWIDNFDRDSTLTSADRAFNAHFWGSYRFDLILETKERTYFQRAEGLRLVDELTRVAESGPHVGGVVSQVIAYEIAADVLGEEGPISALAPETVWRISGLLYHVQRRTDLDQFLRSNGSMSRLRIFVKSPNYVRAQQLEDYLRRVTPAVLEGRDVQYHFSGDLPAAQAVVRSIVTNMLRSLGWTLAGVGLLLAFAFRSLRTATIAIAPLLGGIAIPLGAMGYVGVPLGIATSMFAAVAVGVGVDFALHFLHAYRRARGSGLDHEPALTVSLQSAGPAIRWNAIVLTLGLLVLALSGMKPNRSLGLLLSAAIATCYGTTLLLLPRLLSSVRTSAAVQRGAAAAKQETE